MYHKKTTKYFFTFYFFAMPYFIDRLFSYIEVASDAAHYSPEAMAAYKAAVLAHDALLSSDNEQRFKLACMFHRKYYPNVADLELPYQLTLVAAASLMDGFIARNGAAK